MATSSERSPPPFPDQEDQDVLDSEENQVRDSDEDDAEDLFMSACEPPVSEMDASSASQSSDGLMKLPRNATADPLREPVSSHAENKPVSKPASEASDDFVHVTKSSNEAVDNANTGARKEETPLKEPLHGFVDIFGSETEAPRVERIAVDVTVEATPVKSEVTSCITGPLGDGEQEVKKTSTAPLIDVSSDSSASKSQQPFADPLVDVLFDSPPTDANKSTWQKADPFEEEGEDLFTEPLQPKSTKEPQKSLSCQPDEDIFGEPLGAISKKSVPVSNEPQDKSVTVKGGAEGTNASGSQHIGTKREPVISNTSVNSKTNGILSEEEADLFSEATVELSLDSPRNERKANVVKPSTSGSSLAASASLPTTQSAVLEELEEVDEPEDKFDIVVSVTDPEKIGDGMNAYMAYKVSTQTSLAMFRHKTFTVKRRFSDFLGLYEKLSEKHGPNGFIVPPPPEKSILGMTKVKVGKEDPSSTEFLERRKAALERYLQRVVTHPSLLQDPDVREFLERDELPRAVNTQALSGAGFLKMISKATDAVSKMTIKMNESDAWFEEKLQEVEAADQQYRKLHALVDSLVIHRKELSLNTASFAKSVAMLGSAEDNTALSRALSQLAEVEDKMEQLHQEQAIHDTFSFAELIADYIRLLGAVRGSFDHRMKAWQRWQDAQAMLQKKRETEAKLLWANKPEKLQQAKEDITEWEAKVTQYERDFDRVSATVRKEVLRFEKEKTANFKQHIIKYLESLLQSQQQLIKYWEAFLPEAKAIA
ncbi:sorting nexin-1a [Thalassophryne amazonica]|uniref:sorting nexin-1a n=1 Tax=Thalassophryne amazonica TaxID=390379 RepID=UPI0014724DA9|nr:sorting nexin-1a [Thalassophryne amazonica]